MVFLTLDYINNVWAPCNIYKWKILIQGVARNKTARGDQRFETISGLKPSASYSFRMFAENSLGHSGGTEPVELTITGEGMLAKSLALDVCFLSAWLPHKSMVMLVFLLFLTS